MKHDLSNTEDGSAKGSVHLSNEQTQYLKESFQEITFPLADMIGLLDAILDSITCFGCRCNLIQIRGALTSLQYSTNGLHTFLELLESKEE